MRSTFHLLEVSKRGLFAQQTALNVTGHNISNANTEGYSRQRANMVTTHGIPAPGFNMDRAAGLLGTGVIVSNLQRIREDFLDVQFRNANKELGFWETMAQTISRIEDIMKEPSETGLQKVMDQMWQAWQDLASDPPPADARAVLRERSQAVVDTFNSIFDRLERVQQDMDQMLAEKVMEINSYAQQIAQLNDQIANVVPHGYQPNDLFDQRDLLIDKLSKLTDVSVTFAENGMVNIAIEGQALVNGRNAVAIEATRNPQTGFNDITLGGAEFVPQSGVLAAALNLRGIAQVETIIEDGQEQQVVTATGVVPDLLKKLNILAINMTKEINDIHRNGWSLEDIRNGIQAQIPFFVDADALAADPNTQVYPTRANKIAINPAIIRSLDAIAAAQPEPDGQVVAGNNKNALAIAQLKHTKIQAGTGMFDLPETATLDEYYRYTIAQLGVNGQESLRNLKNTEDIVLMIDNDRLSVSGVSIDDEMSNLIMFQHAYNASARVMTSMDEVLDKIINGMGRVGL